MSIAWARSPHGPIAVIADGEAVLRIVLPGSDDPVGEEDPDGRALAHEAAEQIEAYLNGNRMRLEFPTKLEGTPFQRAVWNALCQIPYGQTASYGEVAAAIGKPGAARAIGQANRRNPLPIIVPCHRVVAADGGLGGYMGSEAPEEGLKAMLLALERRLADDTA